MSSNKNFSNRATVFLLLSLTLLLFGTLFSSFHLLAQENSSLSRSDSQQIGEWVKAYRDDLNFSQLGSGSIIQPTSDGGYIVASSTSPFSNNINVLKIYSDGAVEWRYEYGGEEQDTVYAIEEIPDEGYILLATVNSSAKIWLLKLDYSGSILWQKTYGYYDYNEAKSLLLTSDEGFIITGYTYNVMAEYDALIIKLNSNGVIEWQKIYGGSLRDSFNNIEPTSDGNYLVVGKTESFAPGQEYSSVLWILKISENGEIIWQKTYSGTTLAVFPDNTHSETDKNVENVQIKMLNDVESIISYTGRLLKIDVNGQVIWSKGYKETGGDRVATFSIGEIFEDSIFLVGGHSSPVNYYSDMWIARVNNDGDIIWQRTYGDDVHKWYGASSGKSVRQNFIVSGIRSVETGHAELLVFKLNLLGDIPYCGLCRDVNLAPVSYQPVSMNSNANSTNINIIPENSSYTRYSESTEVITLCSHDYDFQVFLPLATKN